MVDNVGYTEGSGTTIAADDVGGVLFQRVKVTTGADGTATDVSAANPMPVSGPLTDAQLRASPVPVSGSFTVSGGLTDAELRASPVPVSLASAPLPTGAATETTLAQVRDRLPTASTSMPMDTTLAAPVRQAPQRYIDISFSQVGSGLLSSEMALVGSVGTGMAVNQSAGNLVITTGTTANAEVIIRSVASVTGAVTLKDVVTLSQRIANNNFFVELVDVIGDGLAYTIVNATTVDVTRTAHGYTAANVGQRIDIGAITGAAGIPMEAVIASIPNANTIRFTVAGWPATGSGTCSLTGWNKIELNYTGTVATAVNFNTRRRGWQNTAIAATINTTAAAHMGIVNAENGVVSLADKVVTSAGVIANRASWDTNIPRTNETLFLQIRARNGTVAPASTTTWTVGMLRLEDYVPTQVSLVSTRVQSTQNSQPVSVIGTATVGGSVTVSGTVAVSSAVLGASTARAGFVAAHGVWFDDSSTALAANATFTGTSRDATVATTGTAFANAATYAQEVRISAESDVAGTLWLEASRDNTTWRRVKSIATTAVTGGGQYAEIIHRPSWRWWRCGFTNGATIQARFTIGSITTAA
jgi:hypothetical protein